MIEFVDVSKEYKSASFALRNIGFKIEAGEFVYLVGPSGAGKTTVLKLIIREEKPTAGEIIVDSVDVTRLPNRKLPRHRRNIGMIFQDFKLLQKKTVWENVAFSLEVAGRASQEIKEKTGEVLKLVGLDERTNLYPHQISGGEAQRAAIARAVVLNPQILLADEPTGNLDSNNSVEVMSLLEKLNKMGTTVVMATHKEEFIKPTNHKIIKISEGKLVS